MIELTMWSHDLTNPSPLGEALGVDISLRHNDLSSCTVTMSTHDDRLSRLLQPGIRLAAYDDKQRAIFSGELDNATADRADTRGSRADDGLVKVTFTSDLRLTMSSLALPAPETAPVAYTSSAVAAGFKAYTLSQKARERQQITGPAETVLKQVMANNIARLDPRLSIAPDQKRGDKITVSNRFDAIGERTLQAVDGAGLGVQVVQDDAQRKLVLDCYTPRVYQHDMSEPGGTVNGWSWKQAAPTGNRLYVGGQGDGVDRAIVIVEDTASIAQWGLIEAWYDSTDATTNDELVVAGIQKMAELKATASISAKLTQGDIHLVDDLWLGDQVEVEVGAGIVATDRISGIDLSMSQGMDGRGFPVWLMTPIVGDNTDSDSIFPQLKTMARALARRSKG